MVGLLVGVNAAPSVTHAETSAPLMATPWAGYADLVEKIMPSVVTVTTSRTAVAPTAGERDFGEGMPFGRGGPNEEEMRRFMERFFDNPGMPPMQPGQPGPEGPMVGAGSGFIVDAKGLIVTNNHVIDGADEVTVNLNDGREFEAKVLGTDPDTDLALLQIEADGDLPVATFANADHVRVGDAVIAIGNPFGLGGTVTAGIVSAKAREIGAGRYDDFLQIDAPINRGNSGGPTFNLEGEVIGVNTAIHSPSGGNVGIGFAIPADLAQHIIADLEDDGMVERGWLGVHIQAVDEDLAASLGLDDAKGALVSEVTADSPAAASDLKRGDVILRFGSTEIEDLRDLTRAVADTTPGSESEMTVWRQGEEQMIDVEVAQMPADQTVAMATEGGQPADEATPRLGLALAALNEEARSALDLGPEVEGVVVTDVQPGSPAAEKGLREGDVIVEADHQKVENPASVTKALKTVTDRGDDAILLLVKRDGQDRFVAVKLTEA
jgi:serine protease Do